MFTWICPQCGREVSPVETECPYCARKGVGGAPATPPAATAGSPLGPSAPPQPAYNPAPPPSYAPPQPAPPPASFPPQQAAQPIYQAAQPVYQAPPQPVYQQPAAPQYVVGPRPSSGLPTWLLTIVFALAFVGLVGGVYWLVGYARGSSSGSQAAAATTPVAGSATKPGTPANPFQKYIEISGIRFAEDARKNVLVKFTLTNHSDADIQGLAGNATIWARTQKSEEDTVGTFAFAGDVGPQASKDMSSPLSTKLKVYELPDWQNVTTDLQITSPK